MPENIEVDISITIRRHDDQEVLAIIDMPGADSKDFRWALDMYDDDLALTRRVPRSYLALFGPVMRCMHMRILNPKPFSIKYMPACPDWLFDHMRNLD
jgi:hypothetical protein